MSTTAISVIQALESSPDVLHENWCVPREAGRFLHVTALMLGSISICEVGTSIGYSTLWLASAAAKTGGHVHTLEYEKSRQDVAKSNISNAGLDNRVTFYLGAAINQLKQFQSNGQTFDLAFIDAAKKEYIDYIKLLEPMLPAGACLIADNTRSHQEQMLDFLAYMETSSLFDIAELETPNGQLLARKR
jgi:predicted O-methyltransferase YrrM